MFILHEGKGCDNIGQRRERGTAHCSSDIHEEEGELPSVREPKARTKRQSYRTTSASLAKRAKAALTRFAMLHELTRRRMLDDDEGYVFPEGTYCWRNWSGVACVPPRQRQPFGSAVGQ